MSTWASVVPKMPCSPKECYVIGATSRLQTLTHFYLKDLVWQSNPVLLGHFPVFLHELHSSDWTLLVVRESHPPFLGKSPFLLTQGAGVSQLTQLLPWCLWDVDPALLVFPELGHHILRQNTHIPDVGDLPFFSWSHTPRSCLCSSTSQTSWPAVSLEPVSPSVGPTQASFSLFLLTAAGLVIAQFSSFQRVKVPACSSWISSAGTSLASRVHSPAGHSELYRRDAFLSFLTSDHPE